MMKSAFCENGTWIQVILLQRREWESDKGDRAQSQFWLRLHMGKLVDFPLSNIFLQTATVSWVCHLQTFPLYSLPASSHIPEGHASKPCFPKFCSLVPSPPTPVGMEFRSCGGWWQGEIWGTRSCYIRSRVKEAWHSIKCYSRSIIHAEATCPFNAGLSQGGSEVPAN